MKKIILLFLIISNIFLCTSCIKPIPINQRALIQAIGIDYENNKVKLTMQIFSPASEGGSGISSSADNAKIIDASGKSVSDAMQNAGLTQGQKLFLGHTRVIVIGNDMATKGLIAALSYFNSEPTIRQNVYVVIAKKTAKEILTAQINQGMLPAKTLQSILDNAKDSSLFTNVKLYEVFKLIEDKYSCPVLPVITANKTKEKVQQKDEDISDISKISVDSMIIFDEKGPVCSLNLDESAGYIWLTDNVKSTSFMIETSKYDFASMNIYQSKTKLTPIFNDTQIIINADINCKATISERLIKEGQNPSLKDTEELAKAGEEYIKKQCQLFFNKTIIENKADVLNIGNSVWKENPTLFKKVRDNWENELGKIKLNLNVTVHFEKIGLEVSF